MILTIENMTTEISKNGIETCSDYLKEIEEDTGIRPRVSLMTSQNRNLGKTEVYATSDLQPELAEKVMAAAGERIETQRLDKLKTRPPEPWRRLKDYFTEDRLRTNALVRAEMELLLANGYSIEKDYYMAFDIPQGDNPLEKVFFLMASKDEKPILDKHLKAIRRIIC